MPTIETRADADKYLRGTWSGSAGGPVTTLETLLHNDGYFEIPHLIMTYTDFLSGLSSGKGPKTQHRSKNIKKFFCRYYPSTYHTPSAWLIYMYRNGLVHQYAPKTIDIGEGKVVGWSISLEHDKSLKPDEQQKHLTLVPRSGSTAWNLHLIASEFLEDFKGAVELLRCDVRTDQNCLDNLKRGLNAYQEAKKLSEINVCYISEEDKKWLSQEPGTIG